MIFGATRGAGSENGFRPGEVKPTGGLSSIPHRRGNRAAANAGKCVVRPEREEGSASGFYGFDGHRHPGGRRLRPGGNPARGRVEIVWRRRTARGAFR